MIRARQDRKAAAQGDRAIWSFALLLGVLAAGFALALGQAEVAPGLVHALSTILN